MSSDTYEGAYQSIDRIARGKQTHAEDDALDMAIMIAETEDGQYQPAGCCATIREAREMAAEYVANGPTSGLPVPYRFVIWEQGSPGYGVVEVLL